jgi:hypothetical protein
MCSASDYVHSLINRDLRLFLPQARYAVRNAIRLALSIEMKSLDSRLHGRP